MTASVLAGVVGAFTPKTVSNATPKRTDVARLIQVSIFDLMLIESTVHAL
jgi:hypothetical protein